MSTRLFAALSMAAMTLTTAATYAIDVSDVPQAPKAGDCIGYALGMPPEVKHAIDAANQKYKQEAADADAEFVRLTGDVGKQWKQEDAESTRIYIDQLSRLNRYSGGVSSPTGKFLTTRQTVRQIASPEAAQRALNLPPGATAEQLNTLLIPRGTTIYYGRVSGGGETATQIFIRDPSVLRSVP